MWGVGEGGSEGGKSKIGLKQRESKSVATLFTTLVMEEVSKGTVIMYIPNFNQHSNGIHCHGSSIFLLSSNPCKTFPAWG